MNQNYETENMCSPYEPSSDGRSIYYNLDSDPPTELTGCGLYSVFGLLLKFDSGDIKAMGKMFGSFSSKWAVIGGPIIGYHAKKYDVPGQIGIGEFGFILGDVCRPKYFGAGKLILKLGKKRVFKFYWQPTL